MSDIRTAHVGKKCLRCEGEAEGYKPVHFLVGERAGFCERCIFNLLKLMLVAEIETATEAEEIIGKIERGEDE